MAASHLQGKADKYLATLLQLPKVDYPQDFVLSSGEHIILSCFTIDWIAVLEGNIPHKGFVRSKGGEDPFAASFQYDCGSHRDVNSGKRYRPKAYRVPFLALPGGLEADDDGGSMTVSHLCHSNWCLNPKHHVLESLPDNKGRNGCPGPPGCRHAVQCLIPGVQCLGHSSVSLGADVAHGFSL